MIKIKGLEEQNSSKNKIIFSPRPGFTRGKWANPELEFPLIYGHRCPYCSNVIQALFKAPQAFSLWPYEETVILSQGEKNAGDIRKIYPDDKTKTGKSLYRMDYSPAEGGSVKITLKNHILRTRVIAERKYTGEGIWEDGEKPCTRTGIFSLREDLLVKDWMLFALVDTGDGREIAKYNFPTIKQIIPENNTDFKLIPAVGEAPPIILVEKQHTPYGYFYQTQALIKPYIKAGK